MKNKKYVSLLIGAAVIQIMLFGSVASAGNNNTDNKVKFTIHNDSGFTLKPGSRKYDFCSFPDYQEDVPDLDKLPAHLAKGETADFDIDMSIPRAVRSPQYNVLTITYYYKPNPSDAFTWSGCEFRIAFYNYNNKNYDLLPPGFSVGVPGRISCEIHEDDSHHDLYIKNAT
jgi:hypothetical protein